MVSTVKAMKALMNMRKADNENLVDYARRFPSAKDVCKLLGGQMIFKKLIKFQEDCNLWDDMVEVSTKNEKINASQEKIWA